MLSKLLHWNFLTPFSDMTKKNIEFFSGKYVVLNEFFYSGRRLPSLFIMKNTRGYVRIYNIIKYFFSIEQYYEENENTSKSKKVLEGNKYLTTLNKVRSLELFFYNNLVIQAYSTVLNDLTWI